MSPHELAAAWEDAVLGEALALVIAAVLLGWYLRWEWQQSAPACHTARAISMARSRLAEATTSILAQLATTIATGATQLYHLQFRIILTPRHRPSAKPTTPS